MLPQNGVQNMTPTLTRATFDDLMRHDGKAELIDGRIVTYMASGSLPGTTAFEIAVKLRDYARKSKLGRAYADGVGFTCIELPDGRQSFSPDAAFLIHPESQTMWFVEGAPDFAVEVRSDGDYGPAAERKMADKRADYFLAGTQAVWDVDPLGETITLHTAEAKTIFSRGEIAHAEPVLPGWQVHVSELFDDAKL
jgi:Uma2 family endonuclease